MARLPSQQTLDVLMETLSDRDGFLRYKVIAAIETLRRDHPQLEIRREPIERLALAESLRFFNALTLHANLCHAESFGRNTLLARALEEKQRRSTDRVFRLVSLIYPYAEIRTARAALEHGDARARAGASEYLDNVLGGALRKRVVLMVEDMPLDERVRQANLMFRTRRRDPEDTLAQLIHDEDNVIAASAIHLAAERGVWQVAADMEFALNHHDPRDHYVIEAASWALAARPSSTDERQAGWLEPLPTVELANRLRRLSLFDYVSVDELFRIAETARQVRYEPGRPVCHQGERPDPLQFLIDGEVRFDDGSRVTPPSPLAFEEALEGVPIGASVHASGVAITLSLSHEEFLTLLSDNPEVVQGLFKMLIETRGGAAWRDVVHGRIPEEIARRAENGLPPIDRALLLQESPLLSRATGEHLLRLAAIAREVPLTQGATLVRDGDDPAIYIVLNGELTLDGSGTTAQIVRPGDAVGFVETLAGVRADVTIRVLRAGTALRLDGRELFDLLSDHVDLLQGLFSALLRFQPSVIIRAPAV
jgi:CRP-like cAMP-binding protein